MDYKDKRVFVTGAGGFIGSHLVERLVEEGAKVRALCLYNSKGFWGWLENSPDEIKKTIEVVLGDIRDKNLMENCTKDIDIVFHLAALIAIPYSYIAPESFIDTNIKGTLNLLEGARKNNVKRFVHISTSEVYGTPDKIPIDEKNELKGQSPYSASKIGADKLCEAYFCSYDLPIVIIRPFNTYGPRQSARAVIPTILTQLISKKKILKLGNTKPERDLTFISDTVDGILKAGLKKNIEGETIQLGTGKKYSIEEIAKISMEITKTNAEIEKEDIRVRPDKSEVMVLLSNPQKAKKLLGWEAKVTIEEGILKTYNWLKENLNYYKIGIYQI